MADWFCGSEKYTAVTAWAASTAYSIGDIRRPTAAAVGDERVFRCTTAGTSAGTEPTWVNTKAATTNDNTVVWTEITGDAAYNTLTNFAAPHARMRNLAAWMAAGDDAYVSNAHAATEAATITISFPGTVASPNRIFSINAATGLIAAGASETTTGVTSLNVNGSFYMEGVSFTSGSGNGAILTLQSGNVNTSQTYKDCIFIIPSTNGNSYILIGQASTGPVVKIKMINPQFKFANTAHSIRGGVDLLIEGGSVVAGGSNPANLFVPVSSRAPLLIEVNGFDFSGWGSALNLVAGGASAQNVVAVFHACKMPAAWSGGLVSTAITSAGFLVEAYNISATDTNYSCWSEFLEGNVKVDTSVYMTGGSTDGTTPFSVKMASSAGATFPTKALRTPEMVVRNEIVGSAKTVTVEITHSEAADLTDAEIWLEVTYLGTSGFPLSTLITDQVATVLGTPAAQTTSTQAWTGAGTRKQKLVVTPFTPQEKGDFLWRVALAKASATVYVNANLVIT